jgi:hypothetical protein
MAFGRPKKADTSGVTQDNVFMLATQALAQQRSTRIRLPMRMTFTAPILMHRWTDKAIIQMLGKMVGADVPRGKKDLTKEFESSWYRNVRGEPALPCRIIKASIVDGAIETGGVVTKASLKRTLRVLGWTAPLKFKGHLEMDVRIASNSGTPDLRSRAVAPVGSTCDIVVEFNPTLTPDKVTAAIQSAGQCIGVCDWRPDKGGDYGTFEIEALPIKEVSRIIKECELPEQEFKIPPELLTAFNALPDEKVGDTARKARAVANHVNGSNSRTAQA